MPHISIIIFVVCSFLFTGQAANNYTFIIIKNSSFLSKGQAAVYKVYYKFDIKNNPNQHFIPYIAVSFSRSGCIDYSIVRYYIIKTNFQFLFS